MSLSNPKLINPATKRFEWAGGAGILQYYDREAKVSVDQPLPFRFIVLDQLNTIAGFSKSDQSSIWANEVRDLKKDELYTRTKHGPIEAGLYENLATTVKRGGKFAKSVYIAHELNGNWVIGNFRAYGSALGAWFDFTKAYSVEQGLVVMTRGEQKEAGTGPFFPPAFNWQKWNDGDYRVAIQLDRELQTYLSSYLAAPKVDEDSQGTETTAQTAGYASPEQMADYEARRAAAAAPAPETTPPYQDPLPEPGREDTVINDLGGQPINLDDIPFE